MKHPDKKTKTSPPRPRDSKPLADDKLGKVTGGDPPSRMLDYL